MIPVGLFSEKIPCGLIEKRNIRHWFTYLKDKMILCEIMFNWHFEVPCFGSTVSLSLLLAKHKEGRFLSAFLQILVILCRPGEGGDPRIKPL